jgi:hypothetical protein
MARFDGPTLIDRIAAFTVISTTYVMGTVFRRPYSRMLMLRDSAERDFRKGRIAAAEAKAMELLTVARRFPDDWYYGNAIHHAHLLLGRVAMTRGNYDRAEMELLDAGQTPGSPQLDSFGPNCQLASELLKVGRVQPVLKFLQLCDNFWDQDSSQSATWTAQIRQGSMPDFGANLLY